MQPFGLSLTRLIFFLLMTFIFLIKLTHLEYIVTCKSQVLSVFGPHSEFCLSELSPLYAFPIRNK